MSAAGNSHMDSNVTIVGDLTVTGVTTVDPALTFAGTDLTLTGDLVVGDDATVTGDLTAATVAVGSSGTILTKILKGTIAVTIAADAAAAEEDVSLTITAATVGDIVIVTPLNASMETGVGIVAAWVSANGTVKVRISNFNGSGLTGSTQNWQYCLIRS